MKYYLFLILLYSGQLLAQSSIYDLAVQSATGKTIPMSDYKGKKMLIAVVSAASLQEKNAFSYWDSLQVSNPDIVVMVIPANDLGSITDTLVTVSTIQTPSDKVELIGIASAKKDKGGNQHPLLQWLTHGNKNAHFDADVETDNQIYLISESGALYAVLGKGVSADAINEVLKQADVNQQAIPADTKNK